jgi:hypothetical protein
MLYDRIGQLVVEPVQATDEALDLLDLGLPEGLAPRS